MTCRINEAGAGSFFTALPVRRSGSWGTGGSTRPRMGPWFTPGHPWEGSGRRVWLVSGLAGPRRSVGWYRLTRPAVHRRWGLGPGAGGRGPRRGVRGRGWGLGWYGPSGAGAPGADSLGRAPDSFRGWPWASQAASWTGSSSRRTPGRTTARRLLLCSRASRPRRLFWCRSGPLLSGLWLLASGLLGLNLGCRAAANLSSRLVSGRRLQPADGRIAAAAERFRRRTQSVSL